MRNSLGKDGTATWSLTPLQRALRSAEDGLPNVSTYTIFQTLKETGYSWHRSRRWCSTGTVQRRRKGGVVTVTDPECEEIGAIEQAYTVGELVGLPVWCEDEAGPFQGIPQPGGSWQPEGMPDREPHECFRGGTAKMLTLFRPKDEELRSKSAARTTNSVIHPWFTGELEDMTPENCDYFFPPYSIKQPRDSMLLHTQH